MSQIATITKSALGVNLVSIFFHTLAAVLVWKLAVLVWKLLASRISKRSALIDQGTCFVHHGASSLVLGLLEQFKYVTLLDFKYCRYNNPYVVIEVLVFVELYKLIQSKL